MNATKPSFTRPRSFTRLLIAILLVTAFAMPGYHPSAAQQSIVVNGSFEQPDVTGISLRPAGEVFGNWTVESGSIEIIGGRWQAANGKQVLDMNGGSAGTIFQDLSTVAGQTYRLRFAMAGNPEGGPTLKQMEVRWGETTVGTFSFDVTGRSATNMGWQSHERTIVATAATTRLRFRSLTEGDAGPALDDVSVVLSAEVTPTPTPTSTPAPPAPAPDDVCSPAAPFFPETGYCIDNTAIQSYFQARGDSDTFGLPASRTRRLLGFPAQVFQRHVLRVHPDGVKPMNLLDPDVLPVTTVNFATFPSHNPGIAGSAPPPSTPNYGEAVLRHLQANVSDTFEGASVQFLQFYLSSGEEAARSGDFPALVALEIWGFPTSGPARDPNNANFIYQRFQRGILHSFPDPNNPARRVTRGILLADNLKFVITNDPVLLPADLRAQVQGSRFFNQYCRGNPGWLCRPTELPDTDLTAAFETQRR